MKFGQLVEYNKIFFIFLLKNGFFKNYTENEAGRLVPDLFIFLKSLI